MIVVILSASVAALAFAWIASVFGNPGSKWRIGRLFAEDRVVSFPRTMIIAAAALLLIGLLALLGLIVTNAAHYEVEGVTSVIDFLRSKYLTQIVLGLLTGSFAMACLDVQRRLIDEKDEKSVKRLEIRQRVYLVIVGFSFIGGLFVGGTPRVLDSITSAKAGIGPVSVEFSRNVAEQSGRSLIQPVFQGGGDDKLPGKPESLVPLGQIVGIMATDINYICALANKEAQSDPSCLEAARVSRALDQAKIMLSPYLDCIVEVERREINRDLVHTYFREMREALRNYAILIGDRDDGRDSSVVASRKTALLRSIAETFGGKRTFFRFAKCGEARRRASDLQSNILKADKRPSHFRCPIERTSKSTNSKLVESCHAIEDVFPVSGELPYLLAIVAVSESYFGNRDFAISLIDKWLTNSADRDLGRSDGKRPDKDWLRIRMRAFQTYFIARYEAKDTIALFHQGTAEEIARTIRKHRLDVYESLAPELRGEGCTDDAVSDQMRKIFFQFLQAENNFISAASKSSRFHRDFVSLARTNWEHIVNSLDCYQVTMERAYGEPSFRRIKAGFSHSVALARAKTSLFLFRQDPQLYSQAWVRKELREDYELIGEALASIQHFYQEAKRKREGKAIIDRLYTEPDIALFNVVDGLNDAISVAIKFPESASIP